MPKKGKTMIRIAIGADHRGYVLKDILKRVRTVGEKHIEWEDCGTFNEMRTDYPIYTKAVVDALKQKKAECGVLICGSGIGMSIAANRFPGMRAGLVWTPEVARAAKEDDNVNLLVLPADYLDDATARACVMEWLVSKFKHEEYQQRLDLLEELAK